MKSSEGDYNELLDWLYNLKRFGMKLDLENITKAMKALGNPQDRLKIIHVTGTNGKGSVCAMLESVLRHAGYKVGLFTSPHLVCFEERIQVNREKISPKDVVSLAKKIEATGVQLTFFEFTAAMAFLYFYEKKTDYVVLEVGMGGRLDATNIVNPIATAITSVSFDHTTRLGNTLKSITKEKAGIIKKGVPMFTPVKSGVIEKICRERGAPLITVMTEEDVSLHGEFQRKNAALAAEVARYLGVSEEEIRDGLRNVSWPARLEFVQNNVILDCAHNPDAIRNLSKFVRSLKYRKLFVIFGVMKDKDYRKMLMLLPEYQGIILTKVDYERAAEPEGLEKYCKNAVIIKNIKDAFGYAKSIATEKDLILICGSCYLAGDFLAHINKIPTHPIMFVQ